jgi:hypothetical protein
MKRGGRLMNAGERCGSVAGERSEMVGKGVGHRQLRLWWQHAGCRCEWGLVLEWFGLGIMTDAEFRRVGVGRCIGQSEGVERDGLKD